MLKIFTLVLILATLGAVKARSAIIEADNKCQAKFNVTDKEMNDIFHLLPHGIDGIDRKFKCYAKCVMDLLDYKDENGKMDFKRVIKSQNHEKENALQVTADCEAKHDLETDECERTFRIFACMALGLRIKPQSSSD